MKSQRQSRILELITKYEIETQEEMIERLRNDGFKVTQATELYLYLNQDTHLRKA